MEILKCTGKSMLGQQYRLLFELMPAFGTIAEVFRCCVSAVRAAVYRIFRIPEMEVIRINGGDFSPLYGTPQFFIDLTYCTAAVHYCAVVSVPFEYGNKKQHEICILYPYRNTSVPSAAGADGRLSEFQLFPVLTDSENKKHNFPSL
jgi:hypothetical protein